MTHQVTILEEAENEINQEELTQLYISLNRAYISVEPAVALEYARKALSLAEEDGDLQTISTINNHFGNVYRQQGYYELALRHFHATLKLNQQMNDYGGMVYCYNDIGNIYFDQSKYDDALNYYQKAYKLSVRSVSVRPRAVSLNNMGLVYLNQQDYDKAIQSFKKALYFRQRTSDKVLIAHSYNYLAYANSLSGRKSIAEAYFMQAIDLYEQTAQKKEIGNVYRFMISLCDVNIDQAFVYYEKSKAIYEHYNNRYRKIHLNNEMARLFVRNQNFEAAIPFVKQAIILASDDFPRDLKHNYKLLSEIYRNLGIYDKALVNFESYQKVKDSIQVHDVSQMYNQIQTHYELRQKELELAEAEKVKILQEAELNKTKLFYQILTILFVVLLIFIAFITISYNQKVKTNRQLQLKKDIIESQKEEILKNNTQLKKAKELAETSAAAKGQFLSNITHEIRTPMAGIIGMTELLIQKHPDEPFTNQLKSIKFSGEKLLSIINEILNFSKLETNEIELEHISFNLEELVNELVKSVEINKQSEDVKFIIDFDEKTPKKLLGDPTKLYQILLNIVGNAFKFTTEGHVKISIQPTGKQSGKKQQLKFVIEDTGIGVEQDKLETIFDSFKQASADIHRKFGGTGLGLSIVKKLVEIHGGLLSVKSKLGEGTTFTVLIDYEADLVGQVTQPEQSINAEQVRTASLEGIRILLADDNPLNLEVNKRLLMQAGAVVYTYIDGVHLLKNAEQKDPDLIILDIEMPEMDGLECATRLRRLPQFRKDHFTIIGLTADIFPETKEKALNAGMDFLLTKPLKIQLLQETLMGTKKGKVMLATG